MVFSYRNAGSGENLLFPVSGVGQLSNAKASATMFRGLLISPCCIQPFSGHLQQFSCIVTSEQRNASLPQNLFQKSIPASAFRT